MTALPPATDGRSGSWLVLLTAVVLAIGVAFANALDAGFLFDSVTIVLKDPRIRVLEGARIHDIFFDDYWFDHESNNYRPLTTLSYAIDYALLGHGTDPWGYVLANILIHACNTLLAIALARSIGLPRPAAVLTGLLFGVHPITTEAVTNVVGRADLLAAFGVLGGLLLHVRSVRQGRFRLVHGLGIAAASGIAIGGKENGIVLVGLMLAHDLLIGRPRPRAVLLNYLCCLSPLAAWFPMRAIAFATGASSASVADNPLLLLDGFSGTLTASGILLRYLGLVFWPAHLSADYSFDALELFEGDLGVSGYVFSSLGAATMLALVGTAVVLRRRRPMVTFLLLFFFITIAPVANLFVTIGTIMAERLMYLPALGPIALVALAFTRWRAFGTPWIARGVLLVIVVALATRTHVRNRDWHSELALFQSAVSTCPGSFKAHKCLAGALYLSAKGGEELRARIDRILEHTEKAWKIMRRLPPSVGYSELLADLALYYRVKARLEPEQERSSWLERAEATYRDAASRDAATGQLQSWRVHRGLAETLRDLGRTEEARKAFVHALRLAPGPEVLVPYAQFLVHLGSQREAVLCALRVLTLDPGHGAMWDLVREHYEREFPGERTIVEQGGRLLFDSGHPAVRADLKEAVRRQHADEEHLRPGSGAAYLRMVRASLGFDPMR